MKVSIITVCFNSASTLRETIESVLSQDYEDIEYVVVDGLSTDGTQALVQSYSNKISKFISEKDRGLYDAMNKGIDLATGEIIGILNSDDLYADRGVITKVVNVFREGNADVVYGDLYYFRTGSPDKVRRIYKGNEFSLVRAKFGLMPPHPTFFIRREAYVRYGKFDIQYTLSADFDLILRFLGIHKLPFKYIPELLVKMRLGGKSTSSLTRLFIMNKEDLHSCRKHGVKTNIVRFYMKYFVKLFTLR